MKKISIVALVVALLLVLVACNPGTVVEYSVDDYRTTMQYYDDFKVLQLTDLHLGIEADISHQLTIIADSVRTERPDLVVLTGDSFMYASKGMVNALMETLNTVCRELTAERNGRLCKFTLTLGNHDNQGDYDGYYINEVISAYATEDGREVADGKYAAFIDFEDDALYGVTNFYIDLVDDRTKSADEADVKYRLHIIDSNSYHYLGAEYGYDVIHDDQLDHVTKIFENATADRNYIGLAFFHIPLHEYKDAYEEYEKAPDPSAVGQGELREGVYCGYENNGSYAKMRAAGIVGFFTGHDHINYGDFLYHAGSADAADRAIFSYGVKSTNLLYHDTDRVGYKTVTLTDITVEEFLSIDNIRANYKNMTEGYSSYENG